MSRCSSCSGRQWRSLLPAAVLLGFVLVPAASRAEVRIHDVTHLGGDRWRATGDAADPEGDCIPPHRVAVVDAGAGEFPEDISGARTIGQVQGPWTLEFTFPVQPGSTGIFVIIYCQERHVNMELSRGLHKGELSGTGTTSSPGGQRRTGGGGGAATGAIAGGVGAAMVGGAAVLVRARRARSRRQGHAACLHRHEAAAQGMRPAAAAVAATTRADGDQARQSLQAVGAALDEARAAFDRLVPEQHVVDALLDDVVERLTRTDA